MAYGALWCLFGRKIVKTKLACLRDGGVLTHTAYGYSCRLDLLKVNLKEKKNEKTTTDCADLHSTKF